MLVSFSAVWSYWYQIQSTALKWNNKAWGQRDPDSNPSAHMTREISESLLSSSIDANTWLDSTVWQVVFCLLTRHRSVFTIGAHSSLLISLPALSLPFGLPSTLWCWYLIIHMHYLNFLHFGDQILKYFGKCFGSWSNRGKYRDVIWHMI